MYYKQSAVTTRWPWRVGYQKNKMELIIKYRTKKSRPTQRTDPNRIYLPAEIT